jgi:glycerate kinase
VVLAPDKFKGSLTGAQVAQALANGIHAVHPDADLRTVPVADGGDGTMSAALAAGFTPVEVPTTGPTGENVNATIAVRGPVAVIESAAAGGLSQLPGGLLAPLAATSACTDGGAGLVAALGGKRHDRNGDDLPPGGRSLLLPDFLDWSEVDSRVLDADLILACDVDNPNPTQHAASSTPTPC